MERDAQDVADDRLIVALDLPDALNGLALAESTPGPTILVTQFVGFFAGWNAAAAGNAAGLDPGTAGLVATLLTLWVTFLPCFFFIFAGAPHVERLARLAWAAAALAAITAAVVGVMLNLSVFFAIHVSETAKLDSSVQLCQSCCTTVYRPKLIYIQCVANGKVSIN